MIKRAFILIFSVSVFLFSSCWWMGLSDKTPYDDIFVIENRTSTPVTFSIEFDDFRTGKNPSLYFEVGKQSNRVVKDFDVFFGGEKLSQNSITCE